MNRGYLKKQLYLTLQIICLFVIGHCLINCGDFNKNYDKPVGRRHLGKNAKQHAVKNDRDNNEATTG